MGVWNWWGLEIFVFMAAYVSTDQTNALAAQTLLRAISQTCYMPTVGFRMATQLTIGKNIGMQRPEYCSHYYRTAVKTALSYSIFIFTLFMLFERPVQMIFTQNEELIATMSATWFFFNTFIFFDQIQGVSSSVMVNTGNQKLGGIIAWIGYLLIGIGTISYDVFVRNTGLAGIWIGATMAVLFNAVCYNVFEGRLDWPKFVEEAAKKRALQKKAIEEAKLRDD